MKQLPSTFTGGKDPSYVGIGAQLYAAAKQRGVLTVEGEAWPALSNGEVLALVLGWRRCAARSSKPSWPLWYDIALAALGWQKPGDRFIAPPDPRAPAHIKAPVPAAVLVLFWRAIASLGSQLDGAGTIRRPLYVVWTIAGYGAGAREAWSEMKRIAAASGAPPPPPPVVESAMPSPRPTLPQPQPPPRPDPSIPPSPIDPVLPPSTGDGGGLLFALLIAALVLTRKRR